MLVVVAVLLAMVVGLGVWVNLQTRGALPPQAALSRYQTSWPWLDEGKGNINIHLISHSHDDAGWQVTADEYQFSTVDVILDNVLLQLEQDPNRRFVYGEVSFLASWFKRQPPSGKLRVKKLVESGQLEIVNGGWVQHDEACPLFGDMIDQTTRGHEWLRRNLPNTRPRIGWQLDPFGHSATQAWLLTQQIGFRALFFARSDYKELQHRYANKSLEYVWRPSKSLPQSQVFTSQFYGQGKYGGYYSFFPFEDTNANERNYVQDDSEMAGYNVDEWIARVVLRAKQQANATQTSHQLWMLGNDFTFQSASRWYANYDKLIHYVNAANLGIRMQYSTPSQYVQAKLAAASKLSVEFPQRTGDLMPLRDGPNEVWSGYFTSRPALKRQFRYSQLFLRAARQIETWTKMFPIATSAATATTAGRFKPTTSVGSGWTDELEGALALTAHHDGITGTARQSVTNDYAIKLSLGAVVAEERVLQSLETLANILPGGASAFCNCNTDGPLNCLNMSTCAFTSQRQDFTVVAYNSLSRMASNQWIEIPVQLDGKSYTTFLVLDKYTDEAVEGVRLVELDAVTLSLPGLHQNKHVSPKPLTNPATHLLVFEASVPAMGFSAFRVEQQHYCAACRSLQEAQPDAKPRVVENEYYKLELSASSGQLVEITDKRTNESFPFEIEWGYYRSHDGKCGQRVDCISKKSGAYLFRPDGGHKLAWSSSVPTETKVTDLGFGFQITQQFGSLVSHTIRLHRDEIVVDFTVLPIPIEDGIGKEVVVRYKAQSIASKDRFFTDSNGRETVDRVRYQRNPAVCVPSLANNCGLLQEPVSSNYYPVTQFIGISDERHELSVVVDAAQGGTSLRAGEVELMVHRRVLHDDFRGVEEPLNETMCGCGDINARPGEMGQHGKLGDGGCVCAGLAVRGRHRIVLGTVAHAHWKRRQAVAPLQLAFFDHMWKQDETKSLRSLLAQDLPSQLDLMTLSSNYEGGTLVRFAHLFELGEHVHATPVQVDVQRLFRAEIKHAEVRSLSGFKDETGDSQAMRFELAPMQVKTLWIQFKQA